MSLSSHEPPGHGARRDRSARLQTLAQWTAPWCRRIGALLRIALLKLWLRLQLAITESAEYSRPNMVLVGIVAIIGFPGYYIVWTVFFPQPYENLSLRLLGAVLAVPLLLVERVPRSIQHYLPAYWLVVVFYSLPFLFTFMLFKNDLSMIWSMSTMAAAVLLVLLINDWVMLAIMSLGGGGLAWLCFHFSGGHLDQGLSAFGVQVPIYLFVLITGSVFNHKAELVKQQKLAATAATSSTIAHELRTPLLGIRSGIGGLSRYVPQLLDGYNLAKANNLPVPHIRAAHLRELESVLHRIDAETRYSNLVIDTLLFNARNSNIDTSTFVRISISDCVSAALERYPFKSADERSQVHWHTQHDFSFDGAHVLMVHVLFNLLKNALQSTAAAGKGNITIWATPAVRGHTLHFRDTGTGIKPEQITHIFDRFYTSTETGQGTGIGLAFCKMVMKSFGGSIKCTSKPDRFAEFELHFPEQKQ